MKRLPRVLLGVAAGLSGLLLLLLTALILYFDPLVEGVIESEGTNALGAPLLLDSARVRLRGGAQLDGLVVLNPENGPHGSDLGEALRVQRIVARSRLTAVLADPVEIATLEIVQPEFTFVFREGRTNWGALMENLSRRTPKTGEADRSPPQRRFQIGKTKIVRPILHFQAPFLPQGATLRLKDIELDRIGNLSDSPTPIYLVLAALLQALLTGALDDAGLPGGVGSTLGGEMEEAVKAFGGLLRGPG